MLSIINSATPDNFLVTCAGDKRCVCLAGNRDFNESVLSATLNHVQTVILAYGKDIYYIVTILELCVISADEKR